MGSLHIGWVFGEVTVDNSLMVEDIQKSIIQML